MKQAIATKWIKALRSGKYKQCKSVLRNGDSYCCLGVLCDISKQDIWKNSFNDNKKYQGETINLPFDIMKWSGIKQNEGHFKYKNGKSTCLSTLNDNGKSFKAIADVIEKNWKEL